MAQWFMEVVTGLFSIWDADAFEDDDIIDSLTYDDPFSSL
jgi:hypothetical protein